MKLILILPSLISFFTFATSAIIQNEISDCILNKKIESCEKICQDLVIEIGSYYKCPQQILGFLSKSFYKSFFQVYSFNRLISGRFNIPELYNAESSNDLYIFKNLAHVKDQNTLLYILLRAHFGKNAFDANAKLILRYIIKHSLTKRILADDRAALMIARKLQEIADYDQLITFLFEKPSIINSFFQSADLRTCRVIVRKLILLTEAQNQSVPVNVNFYKNLLDKMTVEDSIEKFISASIFEGIPEELYLDFLAESHALIKKVLENVLVKTTKAEEENLRVFESISRLLDYFKSKTNDITDLRDLRKYSLLNCIRHDSNSNNNYYDSEILDLNPDISEKLEIEIVAGIGKKDIHFQEILAGLLDMIRTTDILINGKTTIYLLLKFLNVLKHEDRETILDNIAAFEHFMHVYNVKDVYHDLESEMMFLTLGLKPSYEKVGLPDNFIYPVNIFKKRDISLDMVVRTCFLEYGEDSYHDKETVSGILRGLVTHPSASIYWPLTWERPIKTTLQVMKIISESEDLLQIVIQNGIKFQVESLELSRLLQNDVHKLSGILMNIKIPGLLKVIHSERQLINLEKFLGKNIADIFFESVVPETNDFDEASAVEYRNVYHYWLKTAQRGKLLDLDSQFLKLFSKELDKDESKFLLQRLIES